MASQIGRWPKPPRAPIQPRSELHLMVSPRVPKGEYGVLVRSKPWVIKSSMAMWWVVGVFCLHGDPGAPLEIHGLTQDDD